MTKFLLRIFRFSLLFSVLVICLYFATGSLVKESGRMGVAYDKHQLLETLGSPKLILIGGSNLHYGINSKLLEDSLNIPVVNMALQGSIGLKYMFEEVKYGILPGDIVVIAPEYGHYVDLDINGESTLCRLISVYPRGIKYLDFKQAIKFPGFMGIAIGGNIQEIKGYFINRYRNFEHYRARTNKWGDYVWHENKKTLYTPSKSTGNRDMSISKETVNLIGEFNQFVESKNAKLLITFPSIANSSVDTLMCLEVQKNIKSNNVISDFREYIFPDDYFFDTDSHLLYDKRDIRSQILVKDIKKFYHSTEKFTFK